MATKQEVQNCIETIAEYAQAEYKKGKKILPSVCIAQACCESAYLTSTKMRNANAAFGIKVGKSKYKFGTAWKGKAYSTKTKECYDGSTYVTITDMFRAYDTLQEAVEDYYDMLCTAKRYAAAVGASTAKETITAIYNGGYATSPVYITTIMSIINRYDLTQYDQMTPRQTAEEYYHTGKIYTLQSNLYVRESPAGAKKPYLKLSTNAKSNAKMDEKGYGILKSGTRVTCKEIRKADGYTWMKIPSGWICAINTDGKQYIK